MERWDKVGRMKYTQTELEEEDSLRGLRQVDIWVVFTEALFPFYVHGSYHVNKIGDLVVKKCMLSPDLILYERFRVPRELIIHLSK